MLRADRARIALMFRSIVLKNVLLFLVILVVAVVPLSWQYYRDSRDAEIQNLASKLEFFAERGATWLDVPAIATITRPAPSRRSTTALSTSRSTTASSLPATGPTSTICSRRR